MKKSMFMEKYPVYSLQIQNNETSYQTVDEILAHFKELIDNHKIAKYIATFDHYEHTSSLNGEINPNIKDAKNIIFCFGPALPNTQILAVRPRSIGVAQLENSFIIEFLEVPKEQLNELLENWAKSIANL